MNFDWIPYVIAAYECLKLVRCGKRVPCFLGVCNFTKSRH